MEFYIGPGGNPSIIISVIRLFTLKVLKDSS